jgi:hypothetical protein
MKQHLGHRRFKTDNVKTGRSKESDTYFSRQKIEETHPMECLNIHSDYEGKLFSSRTVTMYYPYRRFNEEIPSKLSVLSDHSLQILIGLDHIHILRHKLLLQ